MSAPAPSAPMLPTLSSCVNLQEGATALHLASQDGHVTTVQLLVEAGASLDAQTNVSCYPDTPTIDSVGGDVYIVTSQHKTLCTTVTT